MAADRRVDADRLPQRCRHFGVDGLAHAVKALELVRFISRQFCGGGDRMRVMGGELRIEAIWPGEQRSHRGEIRHIAVHLAGEHRVAG